MGKFLYDKLKTLIMSGGTETDEEFPDPLYETIPSPERKGVNVKRLFSGVVLTVVLSSIVGVATFAGTGLVTQIGNERRAKDVVYEELLRMGRVDSDSRSEDLGLDMWKDYGICHGMRGYDHVRAVRVWEKEGNGQGVFCMGFTARQDQPLAARVLGVDLAYDSRVVKSLM